jgi:predicted ATPase
VTAGAAARYKGRAVLRALTIKSFKAFGASSAGAARPCSRIDTGPLTVLAGPNGAGKSTILQAIDLLGLLARGTITDALKQHDWEYGDLPHLRAATQSITLEVEVEIGASVLTWTLALGTRKHPGVATEVVRVRGVADASSRTLLDRTGRHVKILHEDTNEIVALPPITVPQSWLGTLDAKEDASRFPGLLALKAWAEGIHAFWSLNPSALRSPSRGLTTRVGSDGSELASLLFRLRKRDPHRFAAFVKRVAKYYPRLVDVEPRSGQYGWKYLRVTERWNGEKATFNAKQVSDGLLRLMVVASIPDWEVAPTLVLLDEIENGLHPRLVGGIAGLLDDITATTQVITTTHSPITLNYVPAEATRLVTRGKAGTVLVTPLTRTPRTPEELWGQEQDASSNHPKRVVRRVLGSEATAEILEQIALETDPRRLSQTRPLSFAPFARAMTSVLTSLRQE